MIKESLLKYLFRQFGEIEINLLVLKYDLNKKSIHDYRLAIKKISSIIDFMNFTLKINKNGSNSWVYFKKIYKVVGVIRDCQVLVPMIKKYETLLNAEFKGLLKFLDLKEKESKKIFKKLLDKNISTRLNDLDKLFKSGINRYSDDELIGLMKSNINKTLENFKPAKINFSSYSDMHNLRKVIKRNHYALESINQFEDLPFNLDMNITSLKDFGHLLGELLDKEILIQKLYNFVSVYGQTKEYNLLIQKIKEDNKATLKLIKYT